ncbi:MAG: hypothetical protein IJ400_04930 [Clostridia bacterium]|nr:hypothetical protein [Clostridia bacterium]
MEENIGNDFGWANLVVPNEDIIGQISLLRGYVGANETLSSSIGRILEFQGEKIKLSNAARNGISGGPVFLNNEDYLVFGILVAGDSDGISYAKRIDNLIFTLVDNLNSTE